MTLQPKSYKWLCPFCNVRFKYFGETSSIGVRGLANHLFEKHKEGMFID